MNIFSRLSKRFIGAIGIVAIKVASYIRPGYATGVAIRYYRWRGMKFKGLPNYLSAKIDVDGSDYSLITIGEGVTISSYVRILSHDWSLYTVAKATGHFSEKPIGRLSPIEIGNYSFVGTGSIVMPGSKIGKGCLVGAGTVVRGTIPDYSIVVGSPCKIVGDTRDHVKEQIARLEASDNLAIGSAC